MSDLSDILAQKQLPEEPSEFPIIRQFVKDRYDVTPGLQLREGSIVITVPGSAAAGSLRFQLHELQSLLDSDKQLIIASI